MSMPMSMPAYFNETAKERYDNVVALFKENNVKMENEKNLNAVMGESIRAFAIHPTSHKIVQYNEIYWNNIENFDEEEKMDEKFMDLLKKNETMKVICNLPDTVNRIILINLSGGNTDSRGGGCGEIFKDWEFYYERDFNNQKTFLDFVKLIYRMKGSKYDYWYELYGGFESHISESTLYIAVSFGHGS